jgi:hypothetical protein
MNIHDVPQGISVVIETDQLVYIGRFRQAQPGLVRLQDVAVHENLTHGDTESYVRRVARYGVDVSERDIVLQAGNVRRVRALKDVPKE